MTLDPLLTVAEVAAILKASETFVRKEARIGIRLKGIKLGSDWRFRITAVQAYLTAMEQRGNQGQWASNA